MSESESVGVPGCWGAGGGGGWWGGGGAEALRWSGGRPGLGSGTEEKGGASGEGRPMSGRPVSAMSASSVAASGAGSEGEGAEGVADVAGAF